MNVYIKKHKVIFLSGILLLLVGLLLGYNVNAESDVITMLIGANKKNYAPVFKLTDCCLVPGLQIEKNFNIKNEKNFNIEVEKIYLKDFKIHDSDDNKLKESNNCYRDFVKYVNFTVKNDDNILYNGSLESLLSNNGVLNDNKKIVLSENEMKSIDIIVSMSGDASNNIQGLQGKFNLVVFCTGEDENSGGDSGGNPGGNSGHNPGGGSGYTPKGDTESDPTEDLEESSGEEPADEDDDADEDLDEEIESPDEEVPEEIIPDENPEDDENNLVDDNEKDSEKDETDEENDDELIEISDEEIPEEIDKLVQTGSPIDTLSLIVIAGIFILSGMWIVFKKSKE